MNKDREKLVVWDVWVRGLEARWSDRVRELEAENKWLCEERDLYRGQAAAARRIEERLTGDLAMVVDEINAQLGRRQYPLPTNAIAAVEGVRELAALPASVPVPEGEIVVPRRWLALVLEWAAEYDLQDETFEAWDELTRLMRGREPSSPVLEEPEILPDEFTVEARLDRLDGGWVGSIREMPGCAAQGESLGEMFRELVDAIHGRWGAGQPVPAPVEEPERPKDEFAEFVAELEASMSEAGRQMVELYREHYRREMQPSLAPVEEPEAPKCRCCRCGRDITGHPQECPGCGWTVHEPVPPSPESYDKHEGSDGSPQTRHNSAPEIKVGQRVKVRATDATGTVDELDGSRIRVRWDLTNDTHWYDDLSHLLSVANLFPAPSLNLEGLAECDREIADREDDDGPFTERGKGILIGLTMARDLLVKEGENDE